MTFPLDIHTEIAPDGAWVDISDDVYQRDTMTIQNGRTDSVGSAPPAECGFTVNNNSGNYSPRNPNSPYYKKLGRNTPTRVWLPGVVLDLPGGNDAASTPDHASVSITGDLDIRVDMTPNAPDTWAGNHDLVTKWGAAGQRSYALILFASGTLSLRWSADGTNGKAVLSSVPLAATTKRMAVRATLDVDDGNGSHRVRFFTAPTMFGPWSELGVPGVAGGGGTTSIFDSTTAVRVGAAAAGSSDTWGSSAVSDVHKAEIRNGINGTVVANPNFNAQAAGTTSFADTAGRTWTLVGSATVAAGNQPVYPRFYGEIAELPLRSDISGKDKTVPVKAAGLLRRINQGSQPVNSGLKGYLLAQHPVTYWPLDEGSEADRGWPAAGTYKGSSIHRALGYSVQTFGDGVLATHLAPGMRMNDTNPGSFYDFLSGYVHSSVSSPNALAWDFVFRAEGNNMTAWIFRCDVIGTGGVGTIDRWELQFRPSATNTMKLVLYRDLWADVIFITDFGNTAALDAMTDGLLHHVRFQLTVSGADVLYNLYMDGVSVLSGTRASYNLRKTHEITITYDRQTSENLTALGHVAVYETVANIPDLATVVNLVQGYAGETAGRRLERLTVEAGYTFASTGDLDATMPMGVQFEDYYSNQIAEIETTEAGIVADPRDQLALWLRTRASLYNQDPIATLDYNQGHIAPPFDPTDDDQLTTNDVFAQRREGGSFQATKDTGALSVLPPPNGVGRYKNEIQVNCQTDDMLPAIAGWYLALGTVDEARYARVTVRMHDPNIASNATLTDALLTAGVGDKLRLTNLDAFGVYDDVDVLIVGYGDALLPDSLDITYICVPASPYEVLEMDRTESRIDPGEGGTTLNASVTTTATTMSLASTGFLWTTSGADMPIPAMVGGEEISITAISGAASPQTATVVRSINGIVKAHAAGEAVELKVPGLIAL